MLIKDWVEQRRQDYISEGRPLFLGWPDDWYENYTVCCDKGHVSNMTLKTDKGNVCLACSSPIYLCPPETTEEQLKVVIEQ